MRTKDLWAVAAAICIFSLTACGGGGGSGQLPAGSLPPQPVRSGGAPEAATTVPVAGSVTQSSDDSQGVTANSVTATVSLDEKGLLAAVVSGKGWRTPSQPYSRILDIGGLGPFLLYSQSSNGGPLRDVYVLTDRQLPTIQAVKAIDTWASSTNVSYPSRNDIFYDVEDRLTAGVSGTLNGVKGTLFCIDSCDYASGSSAQITLDSVINHSIASETPTDDGRYRNSFKFVPESVAQNPPADDDYLVLGFWEYVPAKWTTNGYRPVWGSDGFSAQFYGEMEYGVFANGSDPFEQSGIRSLAGTATYQGSAMASYVDTNIDTSTNMGKESSLFADVALTANFGSASENGTISGSVRNFRLVVPDYPDPYDLTTLPTLLTLNSASIGNSHSGFFKGDTAMTFDGSSFAGKWGGQFYGNGKADGRPGSAAGTFGAATADGSKAIIGVFGTHKQ